MLRKAGCCGVSVLRYCGVAEKRVVRCGGAANFWCGAKRVPRKSWSCGVAKPAVAAFGATGTSVLRCCELLVLRWAKSQALVGPCPVPVRLLEAAPWVLGLTVAKASRRL